jgi:hypothetical protein
MGKENIIGDVEKETAENCKVKGEEFAKGQQIQLVRGNMFRESGDRGNERTETQSNKLTTSFSS